MNPKDRKGKGIAMDDGDETIASIARRTRSSARPERLLGGAIQADAAERRRKTAVDEATAAAEAEKVVEWLRWRKRRESPPKPSVGKRLRDRGRGKSMIPGDETDSDEDEEAGPSAKRDSRASRM
ncbi:unnamed protein product [Microthlaspi erraticum]|uniref:Uncharacterized protein n=1 Tax=Microthlaspi erraticum TaxID=1685480 RepID=A0A6D2HRK8_9BRAS|nr:unnamed protein product [Microthlaspi erraticum]